ncbi:ABC-type Fe3+-hydroxamate transport system, substrate-binding protein [Reichenbachiella faecimaris]|uniref:ABC-type Fe3+-hydroxamate transport system, substrate-binding protein n=1 Tax=Reichenbachiella faecimaris TaxID=692418 RepID=A0A1W2GP85_REIFA|nr:helical backbone metal receptor [Reichenbachiella faecimaris]SMD38401.1 ABC-type Fe3+-hydroxamate transport system, substrate-binding protein [Reichenbachiella faecimaris]
MQIIDDLNQTISMDSAPQRIISLVPSLTELLFDLGLGDRIVGVTKFCIHPPHAQQVAKKVGGTKKFNFEQIKDLEPDLIIANKEENYKEGIEQLCQDYTVYISDIFDLEDAVRTILNIGRMTQTEPESKQLVEIIQQEFEDVKDKLEGSVLYLIWQDPVMVAASDNFIDFLLRCLGLENVAGHLSRYPELDHETLRSLSPDYVFLSSEPYPFKEKHLSIYKHLFPNAEVMLVDGEMFSWYGSRLVHSPKYFMSLPVSRRR